MCRLNFHLQIYSRRSVHLISMVLNLMMKLPQKQIEKNKKKKLKENLKKKRYSRLFQFILTARILYRFVQRAQKCSFYSFFL